ncbi:MAG: NACHT domain-containing protein [Pseudonocardiaceae bacterium]
MTEAVGGDGGTRFAPLTGMAAITEERLRPGTLRDLLDVYSGLDSGRLIILGGPGAGKTSAAITLLLDALKRRAVVETAEARARVPVPLLFTLRGWDPNRKKFADWLADRLEHDYEFLAAREYGPHAAAQLIAGNCLTVILDGLDEIPEGLRPAALRELDEQATFRLVVLTRSDELVDAVSGAHLIGAAALELCPIEPRQAAEYLAGCQIDSPSPAWQRVVEHLRDNPHSILAQALDTPLMVTLVRDTYRHGDPVDELIDSSRFASRETIEDHLLDRVLPIAYAQHPARPAAPCTVDEARQRLGFLARHMNSAGTRDLAWWQVARWLPAWPRALVSALVVGLAAAPVVGIVNVLSFGLNRGLAYGLLGGLFWALVFGLGSVVGEGYSQRSGWLPWRRDDVRTPLLFGLMGGLVFGLANGLLAGLLYGSAMGLAVGLAEVLSNVLLVRVAFVFFARIAEPSVEAASSIDPLALWRRERQLRLKAGLVFGLTAGLAGVLECGIAYALHLDVGIKDLGIKVSLVAAFVGLLRNAFLFGLGVALVSSATWTAALASAQLRRHGKASGSFLSFLEDAHARGVLRCVGPVYQFRHARLQDRLARVCE